MEAATMSKTLNLFDRLLALGRNYQQLHRDHEALHILGRLARLPDLPTDIAEETQARLAELNLQRKKPGRAQRHLAAALVHCPDNARYHFLIASALIRDKKNRARAVRRYRLSLKLEPNQPACLCAYGLLLVRSGQAKRGLELLRRAAGLAPDDPAVIGKLIRGLRLAHEPAEARRVLIAARFRNPHDGRFVRLYNDFMFGRLRRAQARRDRLPVAANDRPMLLPFVRLVGEAEAAAGEPKLLRLDPASPTPAPHTKPRSPRRSDWKHG